MSKAYRIESEAGVVLGIYCGENETEAYKALCDDAGHDQGDGDAMDKLTFFRQKVFNLKLLAEAKERENEGR